MKKRRCLYKRMFWRYIMVQLFYANVFTPIPVSLGIVTSGGMVVSRVLRVLLALSSLFVGRWAHGSAATPAGFLSAVYLSSAKKPVSRYRSRRTRPAKANLARHPFLVAINSCHRDGQGRVSITQALDVFMDFGLFTFQQIRLADFEYVDGL